MITNAHSPWEDPTRQNENHPLTYPDLKALFPHILDIHANRKEWFNPDDMPVEEWFRTASTVLVDPSAIPKAIGRAFFLKQKAPIDLEEVKRYLRKNLNGSADKAVPLNQLSILVSGAVHALTTRPPKIKEEEQASEEKKITHLNYRDLRRRFPHLFEIDAIGRVKFNTRNTPVEEWFKTKSKSLVSSDALAQIIGRAFYLKYRKTVNRKHVHAHLNGSVKKPVEIRRLAHLVSKAISSLIKGPTERPDPKPTDVAPERPVQFVTSIFVPKGRGKNKVIRDMDSKINKKSPEYIISAARGHMTPLKRTTGEKSRWTEKQICARVFAKMQWKHEVDDIMLRDCITAAWDQLSGSGSGYEGSKRWSNTSWNKPINLASRKK